MPKVFYGWVVLGGLFLCYAASNGIMLNSLPLFFPSLIEEFGWNEAQVTGPAGLSFLVTAIFSIGVGILVDRVRPRPLMILGAMIFVLTLISYRFITSLWQLSVIYVMFSAALSLCGILPSMVVASRWFTKYRGVAVGILLMASSFGGAVFPLIIRPYIEVGDWRMALYVLAASCVVVMVLPTVLLLRNDPSEKDTTPDGLPVVAASASEAEVEGVKAGISLGAAMATPMFWLLVFSTMVMWFCISGVVTHQAIYLGRDLKIEPGALTVVVSTFFFCSILGKLLFGYLSDRFPKGSIMLLATVNLTIGLLLLRFASADSMLSIYVYAVVYGIGFSGAFTMIQLMIAELFAGPTYGKILGVYVFADSVAGAIGIWTLGAIRVAAEGYLPAIDLMIGLCIAATVCVIMINRITARETARQAAVPA